jgi:hypothetical protein
MSAEECSCCIELEEGIPIDDEDICALSRKFPVLILYKHKLSKNDKFIEKMYPIVIEAEEPVKCGENTITEPGVYHLENGVFEKIV